MTALIVFGSLVWGALLGMTIVLIARARRAHEEEERTHSLVETTKHFLLDLGDYAAHQSKKGFFHFLRVLLVNIVHGYRALRRTLAKHHTTLVHYIDGKGDVSRRRQAASLYMKNISVHKEDAKKNGTGHIVE
ncbi:hypothetical protein CL654_01080 [bacterium]|nr:hypothetical protein [bacterium]|tara:strand:+ start:5831 stop:6229 length:399 start_codon:yes stop_codon:yes gene_type:complete